MECLFCLFFLTCNALCFFFFFSGNNSRVYQNFCCLNYANALRMASF